ncbi:MAG TPA: hypothetical protein VMZ28_21170 [Kofleriaceae bacterium]|nr:hypothetical protein [Kofleriaceae bacterium]
MLKRTKEKRLAELALVAGGAVRGTTRCGHSDGWAATCDGDGGGGNTNEKGGG